MANLYKIEDLLIGKISEENHTLQTMKENNASNGRQSISFKHMQMVAEMKNASAGIATY